MVSISNNEISKQPSNEHPQQIKIGYSISTVAQIINVTNDIAELYSERAKLYSNTL